MADDLDTIWKMEPHTKAKHHILKRYLDAWLPILNNHLTNMGQHKPLKYVDAFAGPGIYLGGEPGSPIIALETALNHQLNVELHLYFIEGDKKRYKELNKQVEKFSQALAENYMVHVKEIKYGSCEEELLDLLNKVECFGPALVFLDQFGYSSVPMSLINNILEHKMCETFSYLSYDGINRFLHEDAKDDAKNNAFGCEDWKKARQMQGVEQTQFLLKLYRDSLQKYGGADYVWDFAMRDKNNKLIYWLFFCSNNERGLEEMKKAMLKIDESGDFAFSDNYDPNQLTLFKSTRDENWLRDNLIKKFGGQTVRVRDIKKYVLCSTPFVSYAQVLRNIKLKPVNTSSEKISFIKDLDTFVEFPMKPPEEQMSFNFGL